MIQYIISRFYEGESNNRLNIRASAKCLFYNSLYFITIVYAGIYAAAYGFSPVFWRLCDFIACLMIIGNVVFLYVCLKCVWLEVQLDRIREELDRITPSYDELRKIGAKNPPPAEWFDRSEECPFVH